MSKTPVPMLAATLSTADEAVYPLIASPKLDGVRCITMDWVSEGRCVPVSRNLKRIRNQHIFDSISQSCPPGLDGELIIGDLPGVSFSDSISSISKFDWTPDFRYCLFDYLSTFKDPRWYKGVMTRFEERLAQLKELKLPDWCIVISQTLVRTPKEFMALHDKYVEQGYEGICARTPHSPYKFGRSTLKECWLLKFKTFIDTEAVVVGFEELQHNSNAFDDKEAVNKRRTSHQAGMVPMGTLGALRVKKGEIEFGIGTGFDSVMRQQIWDHRDQYLGKTVKFKHQPFGAKDKPRMPVFLGFRDDL